MSGPGSGQIVTFYSYKGGVGRSMALANVATLLAQRGARVLVIDFDLEAPGLHRYFLRRDTPLGQERYRPATAQLGVIDLFHDLAARLASLFPDPAAYAEDRPAARTLLEELVAALLDSERHLYRIELANPNHALPSRAVLSFLSAGRLDDAYAARVHDFDWRSFYARHGEALLALGEVLRRRYDWILVDSRTGVADIASVCTVLLPDKLVLVFSPSEQALEGAIEVGRQALRERARSGERVPLQLLPLLARVEDSEEELKRHWVERAQQQFTALLREAYERSDVDLTTYFQTVRVPHRSYYAYGERIAAEEQPILETGSLAEVFSRFVEYLERPDLTATHRAFTEAEERQLSAFVVELRNKLLAEARAVVALGERIWREREHMLASVRLLGALSSEPPGGTEWMQAHPEIAEAFALLAPVLHRWRFHEEAVSFYRQLLVLQERTRGRRQPESVKTLILLAEALEEQGQDQEPHELREQAIALSEGAPEVEKGLAAAYFELGRMAQERDLAMARSWYDISLSISKRLGDERGTARTYHQLGTLAQERHDLAAARVWFEQSLSISEKLGDEHGAASAYHRLGLIAQEQRDLAVAHTWYEKSLALFEKLGDEQGAAMAYHQFGRMAEEQRDLAQASAWYKKSLAIFEKMADEDGAATVYHQLGKLAQEQQDLATARTWYEKSLVISERQGNQYGAASTYGQLGLLAGMEKQFEAAARWLLKAITAFRRLRDEHNAQESTQNFARLYRQAPSAVRPTLRSLWIDGLGSFPAAFDDEVP